MKVVIDTNIFVSSFFGGNARHVIDYWKNGKITICFSGPIIDEYIDVLHRMKLSETEEMESLLELFRRQFNSLFAAQPPLLHVCSDPDDDKFIEAAVALNARYIISGDKHLKSLKQYAGISIVSPREFLENMHAI